MKERARVNKKLTQHDYNDECHIQRLKFRDRVGDIIAEHNSHGLCYDLMFNNGEIATYDPDELDFFQ